MISVYNFFFNINFFNIENDEIIIIQFQIESESESV